MKVFFGTAIQAKKDRNERSEINEIISEAIKKSGGELVCEHILGKNIQQTAELLEESVGPLPPSGKERSIAVRNTLIDMVEGDIDAAIFEVSIPSLGTGIEIAHAYLRPKMGIKAIPILLLYQKDFQPNKLSSMLTGITPEKAEKLILKEYNSPTEIEGLVKSFLAK